MSERMSLKDRISKLTESSGGVGIPMPQVAGTASMPRVHRTDSNASDDRSRSESNLFSGAHTGAASVQSSQSERSLLSEGERNELHDSFALDGDGFNAVAMSKPIMAARRRPSQVTNLASMIPAENRLTSKDLAAVNDDAVSSKRPQSTAFDGAPKSLSPSEQWILDTITRIQKDYESRIALLEQETKILRDALTNAKIPLPPRPILQPLSPIAPSTAASAADGKSPTNLGSAAPGSPLPKRVPPVPSLPRRMSTDPSSGDSPKAPLRREPSSDVEPGLASPANSTAAKKASPAVSSPKRAPPVPTSAPAPVVPQKEKEAPQSLPEKSHETPFDELIKEEPPASAQSSVKPPVPVAPPSQSAPQFPEEPVVDEDDEDIDDDLKDML